ncbi:MAG: hypothetical protein HY060_12195, partial [Proteobacteria bacterium]|nr:hypothetical protein [Pseudomonadota bacterium]
ASSLIGDFYFKRVADSSNSPIELTYWQSIQGSKDPRDFRSYLEKYLLGQFAALTRNRFDGLSAGAQPAPSPMPAPASAPTQVAATAPTARDLAGRWTGKGAQWQVDVTMDVNGLRGHIQCRGIALPFGQTFFSGGWIDTWTTYAEQSNARLQVKGTFPELTITNRGRNNIPDVCTSEEIRLAPAK